MNEASVQIDEAKCAELTAQIVASHVSHNAVASSDLPGLINSVASTLRGEFGSGEPAEVVEEQAPAVSVKKSITPDYLICLEDGKKLKMLKRHLRTSYDMSPEEYRAKWGLRPDYPMVAPNYAKQRSQLARDIGLGRGSTGRKPKDASASENASTEAA